MDAEILRDARDRLAAGERLALATLVATRGSTPQKVGARVLVRADGGVRGTLGGGAVEAAAVREARARLAEDRPVLREYGLASATDEWGLACGGTMVVFVEPLGPGALPWVAAAADALGGGEPLALVTPVEGEQAGRRLLVREAGRAGTLGDAALDGEAEALGRLALAREAPELARVGNARAYAEVFAAAPMLVVAGAGHVGKALARLAKVLGLRVMVVDDRPEYASRERFPEADEVVAAPVPETLARLQPGPRAAVVVAMRTHDLDYEATAAALRTRAGYVGLVGSRRKAILVAERLLGEGHPPARVRALRSPIGLDIGARTPEEIALAILGEWIMLRQGGSGAPLRLADELFDRAAARAAAPGRASGDPGR